jgi:hypothetical protein
LNIADLGESVLNKNKLDAIDLIITVLQEHEESLDNMISRLDTLTETPSTLVMKMEYNYTKLRENQLAP